MPLYKIIQPNPSTQILVWKITESFDELRSQLTLKPKTEKRLQGMKSETHQRAFMSVRMLIREIGISDFDLHYDELGKPYLSDHRYISITHSHHFAAIIISDETVGIDMELQRDKIIRIADKFVNPTELNRLQRFGIKDYVKKLTVKWGAKEAIFKIRNEKGISFKDHIQVNPFEIGEKETIAFLEIENTMHEFTVYYEEFEGFTLVYAFEK